MNNLVSNEFKIRLREVISVAWSLFIRKVANESLPINKEASMQLQYAYILQQLLPLICFKNNEKAFIELETGVQFNLSTREIDLLLIGQDDNGIYKIAIEMKYYRTLASSGKNRGATNIFMKDVYVDLELLENYVSKNTSNEAVALVMTDKRNLVFPKNKNAKCWNYDISHNKVINNGINITTPIGGKDINITLLKSYNFQWEEHNNFYFLELQGN